MHLHPDRERGRGEENRETRKAINWIILGAENGQRKANIRPEKEWITGKAQPDLRITEEPVRKSKAKKKVPEVILHEGKPGAIILDIDACKKILERLLDGEDLKMLGELRKILLKFRKLDGGGVFLWTSPLKCHKSLPDST